MLNGMRNISDDELDKAFREAADKGDFPYDPQAWADMQARLDAIAPATVTTPRLPGARIVSSLVAAGIIALLWIQTNREQRDNSAQVNADTQSDRALAVNPSTESQNLEVVTMQSEMHEEKTAQTQLPQYNQAVKQATESKAVLDKQSQSRQQVVEPSMSASATSTTSGPVDAQTNSQYLQRKPTTTSLTRNSNYADTQQLGTTSEREPVQKQSPLANTTAGTHVDTDQPVVLPVIASGVNTVVQQSQADSALITSQSVTQQNERTQITKSRGDDLVSDSVSFPKDSLQRVTTRDDKPADSTEVMPSTQEKKSGRSNAFAIRAVLAPDLTTVGFDVPTKVGYNYGLMIDYQFASHWVISAGAVLSRKRYDGSGIEYSFNSYRVKSEKMNGDCQIIDLPVNLYYYWRPDQRVSFFAGAGLTSYLMRTEDYAYTVKTNSGLQTFKQHVAGKNNDWFKQLNLSVGIQSRLTRRLYVQAEPFVKAPLAGVGEGKVSLASLGAFLNLRYVIPITKKN